MCLQVQLCTLMFQSARQSTIPMDALVSLRVAVDRSDLWQMYRISRQAMRYGQYSIAEFIFSDLAYKVCVELSLSWWGGVGGSVGGLLLE